MLEKRLVENGVFGRKEWYLDTDTGDITVRYVGDADRVEQTLNVNHHDASEFRPHRREEVFRPVAEIPPEVFLKWMHEEGLNIYDEEAMRTIIKKKLNSGEYSRLRKVPDSYRIKET